MMADYYLKLDGAKEPWRGNTNYNHIVHLGQRKLLLSEVHALTRCLEPTDKVVIVYAGAAEGFHIPLLNEMFKDQIEHIYLYDPNPFCDAVYRMTNVTIGDFFTDEEIDIRGFRGRNIVFISDIRLDAFKETQVIADNQAQMRWTRMMQPRLAMLKFRAPFIPNIDVDYIKGDIFLQPRVGASSTETRLIIDDPKAPDMVISSTDYEQLMAAYNRRREDEEHECSMAPVNRKALGVCGCLDCKKELSILQEYLDKFPNSRFKSVVQLLTAQEDTMHSLIGSIHGRRVLEPYSAYMDSVRPRVHHSVTTPTEYEFTYRNQMPSYFDPKKTIEFKEYRWHISGNMSMRLRVYHHAGVPTDVIYDIKIREMQRGYYARTQTALWMAQEVVISSDDFKAVIAYSHDGTLTLPAHLQFVKDGGVKKIYQEMCDLEKDVKEVATVIPYANEGSRYDIIHRRRCELVNNVYEYKDEYEVGSDPRILAHYLWVKWGKVPYKAVKTIGDVMWLMERKGRVPPVLTLGSAQVRDSILFDKPYYYAMPKVDGVPVIVLISRSGLYRCIHIKHSNGLVVLYDRYLSSNSNSGIFEGEYLVDGDRKVLYLFDCMQSSKYPDVHLKDLAIRRKEMKSIIDVRKGNKAVVWHDAYRMKEDEFNAFQEIYHVEGVPTDGIIFTPVRQSYDELYTKAKIYKWKPRSAMVVYIALAAEPSQSFPICNHELFVSGAVMEREGVYACAIIAYDAESKQITCIAERWCGKRPTTPMATILRMCTEEYKVGELSIDLLVIDGKPYTSDKKDHRLFTGSVDLPFSGIIRNLPSDVNHTVCEFSVPRQVSGAEYDLQYLKSREKKQRPNPGHVSEKIWRLMVSPTEMTDDSVYGHDIYRCRRLTRSIISEIIEKYHTMDANTLIEIGAGRGANIRTYVNVNQRTLLLEPNPILYNTLARRVQEYKQLKQALNVNVVHGGIVLNNIDIIKVANIDTIERPHVFMFYIDTYMDPNEYEAILHRVYELCKIKKLGSLHLVLTCMRSNWEGLGMWCKTLDDGRVVYRYPDDANVSTVPQYYTDLKRLKQAFGRKLAFNPINYHEQSMYDIVKASGHNMKLLNSAEQQYLMAQHYIHIDAPTLYEAKTVA